MLVRRESLTPLKTLRIPKEAYKRARNGSNVTPEYPTPTFYLQFMGGEDYPGPACVMVLNGVDGFV